MAVMGAESAAEVVKSYKSDISDPRNAVASGSIDEIIEPAVTRSRVIEAMRKLAVRQQEGPWKKHGCMPL